MARNPEVDAWLAAYDNPMKPVVARVRQLLLASDKRIEECIKWQSPTFTFQGNLASFNPRSKQHASLMFHTGAQIPGRFPRLSGSGDTARFMKLASVQEADAARGELEAIVTAWIALKSGAGTANTPKRKSTEKGAAAKASAVAKKKAPRKPAAKKKASKRGAATRKKAASRRAAR